MENLIFDKKLVEINVENGLILPGEIMIDSVSEISALWRRVLNKVNERLDDQRVFDSFLADSYIEEIDGNKIIVIVNSGVAASVLGTKYINLINDVVKEVSQTEFNLIFVEEGKFTKEVKKIEPKSTFFNNSKISPNFTFKNFVVGTSNKEAYQASIMMSKPGSLFNPLFIYSDSGLGKTHLLHAIGNAYQEEAPNKRVLYISAADFIDEFVKYIQNGQQGEETFVDYFKNSVDVLLLDDVQYLVGKKATLDMFFNVFQALYTEDKQIVLTSDQHPAKLDGFPERLKTRFASGLTVSMTSPDVNTAIEILKTKITARNLDLEMFDQDLLKFYGEKFSSSVRELESALNRLIFYTINYEPTNKITLAVGRAAVADLIHIHEDDGQLSEKKIISAVADYYNVPSTQITGKIRTAQIALARHIAMYLIRVLLDTPFDKIGQMFSGKDHSTVMSGVTKVEKMLKTDPELVVSIKELKDRLKNA